jgi:hypothetical protein
VDRVACPWLIKRFVDSQGEFLFVPKGTVEEAASRQGAIPFDAPDTKLGHKDGKCTFDAIVEEFGLTDKALLRMAQIVRAADTNRPADDPIAPGLLAIAAGYSIRFPDDIENLNRQFEVYDAIYAWCRLEVAGDGK